MTAEIQIPSAPQAKKQAVPITVDTVARSIAKPDAFAKPAVIGKPSAKVRVRLTNQRPPGRPRKRPRDPRDVKFY